MIDYGHSIIFIIIYIICVASNSLSFQDSIQRFKI